LCRLNCDEHHAYLTKGSINYIFFSVKDLTFSLKFVNIFQTLILIYKHFFLLNYYRNFLIIIWEKSRSRNSSTSSEIESSDIAMADWSRNSFFWSTQVQSFVIISGMVPLAPTSYYHFVSFFFLAAVRHRYISRHCCCKQYSTLFIDVNETLNYLSFSINDEWRKTNE